MTMDLWKKAVHHVLGQTNFDYNGEEEASSIEVKPNHRRSMA